MEDDRKPRGRANRCVEVAAVMLSRILLACTYLCEQFCRVSMSSSLSLSQCACSASGESLYMTLGLKKGASEDEIKKAYKKVDSHSV